MAIENTVSIWIDGIPRTANLVLPLKFGNFLDERLDECNVSLRLIDEESFTPLTPVEIHIKNQVVFHKPEQTLNEVYYFVIANDDAEEAILGSGLYNHELYLLEVTKVAECVVCDTITFTNDLGKTYTDNSSLAEPVYE